MALLCTISSLYSQQKHPGSIIDKETGKTIPFSQVTNLRTREITQSDMEGNFKIQGVIGKDSLKFSAIGYKEIIKILEKNMIVGLEVSLIELTEFVVSSNRELEKRTQVPMAISSISSSTIEANKPTTIDEVLNQTPGVNMVNLGNEQHSMSIRRPIDYGASYLYLEDGIPIRTSGVFNHNALLEINMAQTKKIEIIRGPASNIYGSEAIGGAINFISRTPTKKFNGGVSVRGNDIGYKRTDFYASNTFRDKLGTVFSGYYANQNEGVLPHSDFNKLALSLGSHYTLNNRNKIEWNSTFVNYYSDMSGSLDSSDFYKKSYSSNHTFTYRKVRSFRTKLAFNHFWSDNSKTSVIGYYRNNSIKQNPSYRVKNDFKPWIPIGNRNLAHGEENNNGFNSFGFIAQHKQNFTKLNSSLIIGTSIDYSPNTYQANYIHIHRTDEGIYDNYTRTDSLLADYQANLLNSAIYVEGRIEPLKRLNIIGALRFDNFNYRFNNALGSNSFTSVLDGENTFNRITPKVGITYDFKKGKGIYSNFSQGFVPPQVSELYRGKKIPELSPVTYNNYEIGGWLVFLKNKVKLDVSVYQMDGVNEIISVLLDDGSRVRKNAGKTTHKGIEYSAHLAVVKELNLRLSGTNAIHKFVDFKESGVDFSGKYMSRAPKWIANAQLTYKPDYLKGFRASIEWQHIDEYFMDQQNAKVYEGYDIINLRFGYQKKSFEIWTNLMNAMNSLYATAASSSAWGQSYSLGRPRNINLGIAYKFQQK